MYLLVAGIVTVYFVVVSLLRKLKLPNLTGKYVFITGCDSGFGNLLAKKLDEMGIYVFAGCLTDKAETELTKSCSRKLRTVHIDVTSDVSISNAVAEVEKHLPDVKGLWAVVNNAGVGGAKQPLEWTKREEFIATLEVNLYGVVFVSKAFLPLIRRERGRIVNMASAAGRLAAVSPDYCVSKYGVEAFSDAMRRELYKTGVTVHILEPGSFGTPLVMKINPDEIRKALKEKQREQTRDIGEAYDDILDAFVRKAKMLLRTTDPDLNKVVGAYVHAITARFPRVRYIVGLDSQFYVRVLANLPEWLSDFVLRHL